MFRLMAEHEEFDHRREALTGAIQVLNPRERRIFEARRLAEEPMTLEDLAAEFGVSRRGAQAGYNSAGVSRPDGSRPGAREGDGLAHRGSGSSFFASLVARQEQRGYLTILVK
jgi:hypothetical protein